MAALRKGTVFSFAAGIVALTALGLYLSSMGSTLTLAHGGTDGAELAVAVQMMGIPHPTGYPTYVLLAQVFRVLPWGTLPGRLNVFSALAAALTVALVARAAEVFFPDEEDHLPAQIAAYTAGLSLAAAGLFWSQALITEVYSLHTLFLALAVWLLLQWRRSGGAYLPLAGLCLGLGLGNHVSLLFLLPGAILFVLLSRRRLRWSEGLLALGLLLAGLAVYLYLPLRAAADPWLNWGNPRDWDSFWAHVSGQAYRGFLFQVPAPQVLARLSAVAGFLLRDFAPWGVALGLGGLFLLGRRDLPALVLLLIPGGAGLLLALTYGGAASEVHLLQLYVAWALGAGLAAGTLATILRGRFRKTGPLIALLLPMLSIVLMPIGWPRWVLRDIPGPLPDLATALEGLPGDSLLLTSADEETFPSWYSQAVAGVRPDLAIVDVRLLEWPWYRRQLPTRYPGLILPAEAAGAEWLVALLAANPDRPTFALGPLSLPAGYRLRYEGPVYQIVPP